jgi:hypothetical protein
MKIPKIALFILFTSLAVYAQENALDSKQTGGGKKPDDNCGILYGRNHALTFCAPDGWLLDNGIMNDQGIYAVFYPKGSNWGEAKKSKTFMYINVVDMSAKDTVATRMDADVKEEKQYNPKTEASRADPIRVGDLTVPVLKFDLGESDGREAVAYIGESKVLVMMVISSKNEAMFKHDYPFFEQLVKSYKFLTSDVHIQNK